MRLRLCLLRGGGLLFLAWNFVSTIDSFQPNPLSVASPIALLRVERRNPTTSHVLFSTTSTTRTTASTTNTTTNRTEKRKHQQQQHALFTAIVPQQPDPYKVLGLPRINNKHHHVTVDQVKARYRKLAKTYHPDANLDGDRNTTTVQFQTLQEAYQVVLAQAKRYQQQQEQRGKRPFMRRVGFDPPPTSSNTQSFITVDTMEIHPPRYDDAAERDLRARATGTYDYVHPQKGPTTAPSWSKQRAGTRRGPTPTTDWSSTTQRFATKHQQLRTQQWEAPSSTPRRSSAARRDPTSTTFPHRTFLQNKYYVPHTVATAPKMTPPTAMRRANFCDATASPHTDRGNFYNVPAPAWSRPRPTHQYTAPHVVRRHARTPTHITRPPPPRQRRPPSNYIPPAFVHQPTTMLFGQQQQQQRQRQSYDRPPPPNSRHHPYRDGLRMPRPYNDDQYRHRQSSSTRRPVTTTFTSHHYYQQPPQRQRQFNNENYFADTHHRQRQQPQHRNPGSNNNNDYYYYNEQQRRPLSRTQYP